MFSLHHDPASAAALLDPGERPAALVAVERLRKAYGATVAVDDVSLTVGPGEVFGVLGPNGAGKTTLLETLVGLRAPDAGRVRVLGLDPERDRAALVLRVGVQPQAGSLFPNLTVRETLRLWASFHGAHVDPEAPLELVGLGEKAGERVKRLSGGQQQRLRIGLAMIARPDLLFLDEPTGSLDPHARRQLWTAIRAHAASGRTVVLTTHSMEEAAALCDRLAIMDRGRIVALGAPAELVRRHFPDVTLVLEGGRGPATRIVTAAPDETLRAALAEGLVDDVRAVRVEQATLEDVFLTLTGRPLDQDER
jgi:ABC-2 type transport system ATP-binding protein